MHLKKESFFMSCTRARTLAFIAGAMMAAMPFVGLYTAASAELDEGNMVTLSTPLTAKAGALLDRKGRVLSSDSEKYSVCLVPQLFYSNEAVNEAIYALVKCDKALKKRFALPVSAKGVQTGSAKQTALLRTVTGLENGSPGELLEKLYGVFGIKKGDDNAYTAACIRYAALISGEDMLTLSDSPSKKLLDTAQSIAEDEPFVRVEKRYEREYTLTNGTPAAPHLITECEGQLDIKGSGGHEKLTYRLYNGGYALKERSGLDAENGRDIRLSIDLDMQLEAQGLLHDKISQGKCDAGAVCVVSCKTGGILAAASAPGFDPNRLSDDYSKLSADDSAPLFDRTLKGLYRPGSAMKTITALAALDTKAIDGSTYLWCGRWYPLGDTVFSCLYYHGYESVQTALRDSCNVFFYKCSQLLGVDTLSGYQRKMGLGKSVDIPLDNAAGRVVTKESVEELGISWSEGLLLQSAIGQSETAATPLQMAQWAQIIANGGSLKPLTLTDNETKDAVRIIKNDSAFSLIREGMEMAAGNIWGEYTLSSLPRKAAIKTGTPEAGQGYNSTVIGFYPADKPEIAFAVVLENSESAYEVVRPLIEEWEQINN